MPFRTVALRALESGPGPVVIPAACNRVLASGYRFFQEAPPGVGTSSASARRGSHRRGVFRETGIVAPDRMETIYDAMTPILLGKATPPVAVTRSRSSSRARPRGSPPPVTPDVDA